jgi:hypothetical protein
MADGVNINQGAESTLSFLLSLLSIVESYAIIDKIKSAKNAAVTTNKLIKTVEKNITKKTTPIKSISVQTKPLKDQVNKTS